MIWLLRLFSPGYGEYHDAYKAWRTLYNRSQPIDLYTRLGRQFLQERPEYLVEHYQKFLRWYGRCPYLHPDYDKPDFFVDQEDELKELKKAIGFLEKSAAYINSFYQSLTAAVIKIEAHISPPEGDYYFRLNSEVDDSQFYMDVDFLIENICASDGSRHGSGIFEWTFYSLRSTILAEYEPHSAIAAFENSRQWYLHRITDSVFDEPDASFTGAKRAVLEDPKELIYRVLRNTGLPEILKQYSGFTTIPYNMRFRHQHVLGSTGSGKSTLLTYQLLHDISRCMKGECSVVIMDTKRDLIKALERVDGIQDRIVSIDAEDSARGFPVALNILDLGKQDTNDPLEREISRNTNLSMLNYFFSSLMGEGAELTDMQSTVFYYVLDLCLAIPNANLDTLLEILDPDAGDFEKYRFALRNLDPDSQNYFERLFDSKQAITTRRQIIPRIYGLKRNKSLSRLFMASETKLDLYSELNAGKIILINCAKSVLRDSVEIFGRFMLAMIMFAVDRRQFVPAKDRMETFFYMDEAHDIIRNDTRLAEMLSQVRAYKLGLIIAHQDWSQINNPKVRSGLDSNTLIKLAPHEDKHTFRVTCGTVEGTFKAPDVAFSNMPQVSESAYQSFLEENRRRYCRTVSETESYKQEQTTYRQVAETNPDYSYRFDIPDHIARRSSPRPDSMNRKKPAKKEPTKNSKPTSPSDEDGTDFF